MCIWHGKNQLCLIWKEIHPVLKTWMNEWLNEWRLWCESKQQWGWVWTKIKKPNKYSQFKRHKLGLTLLHRFYRPCLVWGSVSVCTCWSGRCPGCCRRGNLYPLSSGPVGTGYWCTPGSPVREKPVTSELQHTLYLAFWSAPALTRTHTSFLLPPHANSPRLHLRHF